MSLRIVYDFSVDSGDRTLLSEPEKSMTGMSLRRRTLPSDVRGVKRGPFVVTQPRQPICMRRCRQVIFTPPKKRFVWRWVSSLRLRWFQSLRFYCQQAISFRLLATGYIPSEDQRAAMARNVIADFFSAVGIKSQQLVHELLEIRIIRATRTRKPVPPTHFIQLVERNWTSQDFSQVQSCPDGVEEDLRARDTLDP